MITQCANPNGYTPAEIRQHKCSSIIAWGYSATGDGNYGYCIDAHDLLPAGSTTARGEAPYVRRTACSTLSYREPRL